MQANQRANIRIIGIYLMAVANGVKAFIDTVATLDEDDRVEKDTHGIE